ncbi:uclacyanin-3-like [Cucurbita maxima]|uniref:Uclacyanin-3-like n=1 Tax=Cucurbita maxima TaxID=3661 RepID=A0A6J1IDG2_CUCMA|nr:uclacyanin-3-like [Cucurbita maxima]
MVMKVAVVFVFLVAVRAVYGADIVVGGDSGWNQGFDYGTWAAGQVFKVGDSLVFNYGGSHSVAEVNEASYKACSSTSVIRSHTGGSTSIPLSATGPRYFLCPTLGHCSSGMKLQINVVAANATPTPPGTTPPANTPPADTPPADTPPSPPSPSAGSSGFISLNQLIFGASIACFTALFVL